MRIFWEYVNKMQANVISYNAAILACLGGHGLKAAMGLLGEMAVCSVAPDVDTYSMLFAECEQQDVSGLIGAIATDLTDDTEVEFESTI